jgi:hypothetical protein
VNEVKFSAKKTIIRPTSRSSTTQTYILELGDQYVRIHTNGATLLGHVEEHHRHHAGEPRRRHERPRTATPTASGSSCRPSAA